MGRCCLACDNTLSYDVVLANGELIRANAEEHAELFWALKGGGGNFGVVTSITYRMYCGRFTPLGRACNSWVQGIDGNSS